MNKTPKKKKRKRKISHTKSEATSCFVLLLFLPQFCERYLSALSLVKEIEEKYKEKIVFYAKSILTCLAGSGKSWFRNLTFISLVSYQIKFSALLAGLWPSKCGKPHWAATYTSDVPNQHILICGYRLDSPVTKTLGFISSKTNITRCWT